MDEVNPGEGYQKVDFVDDYKKLLGVFSFSGVIKMTEVIFISGM